MLQEEWNQIFEAQNYYNYNIKTVINMKITCPAKNHT
jgi:hypothetical protein